jgi:hypothetical protein
MTGRDGMQAPVALQQLAGLPIGVLHELLDPPRFVRGIDYAEGRARIVHDREDRIVPDFGLLVFGHLAVVATRLGRLVAPGQRVPHGLGENIQRHAVILALDRRRRQHDSSRAMSPRQRRRPWVRPAIVEARLRGARLEVVAEVNVVENSTIFGHTRGRLR